KVVQIGRSVVTKVNGPTTVKVGMSGTYSFEVDWYNSSTGRLVWVVLPSTGVYTSITNSQYNISQYIDQNSSYEILDLLKATLVLNGNLSPMGNTTIDMNSLPQGVYLLKLRLADGTYESHKISL
ncbi:hypothetical protein PN623_19930, partial [Parabacteroides distasonis]|nr:hypothetical protein [Parabacteroides distasonis]